MRERRDPCWCQGEHADWPYHSPTGCGKTRTGFALAGGRVAEMVSVEEVRRYA